MNSRRLLSFDLEMGFGTPVGCGTGLKSVTVVQLEIAFS